MSMPERVKPAARDFQRIEDRAECANCFLNAARMSAWHTSHLPRGIELAEKRETALRAGCDHRCAATRTLFRRGYAGAVRDVMKSLAIEPVGQ